MIPRWLIAVLDSALPNHTGTQRDALAEQIYDAICAPPVALAIATAIAQSTHVVLVQRGVKDAAGDLARECGRNSAQNVLFTLGES